VSDDRDDRSRLPPPAIEPLPDLAWARVERAVLAELDAPETRQVRAPRARWPIAVSLAAAAAAVIAILAWPRDDGTATTAGTVGQPSRVVTGDVASEVSFGDAHVTVAPASALVFDGNAEHGVLAVLERGTATFVVSPRHARPPFVVQAGAVGVRVVGTELTVSRLGGDDASVEVLEGVVEVVHHGRTTAVRAGERWSSVEIAAQDHAATARPSSASVDLRAAVGAASPPSDPATSTSTSTSTPTPAPGSVATTTPRLHPDRDTRHRPTPAATAAPVAPSAQAEFEAAAALEATDPGGAIARYRELARGRGAWAGNALYALGRLAYDRGDRDLSRDALTAYVHRFPRGPNAADARALLANLQGASR